MELERARERPQGHRTCPRERLAAPWWEQAPSAPNSLREVRAVAVGKGPRALVALVIHLGGSVSSFVTITRMVFSDRSTTGTPMISVTSEYALRAIVFLAQHHPEARITAEIAEGTLVPQGYLSKIMQAMVRHGLVRSQRGLGGGFTLARTPAEISVWDVLTSVDSPVQRITHCPLGLPSHTSLCPVHKLVDEAAARTESAFRSANISTLLASTRGIKPLCEIPSLNAALAAGNGNDSCGDACATATFGAGKTSAPQAASPELRPPARGAARKSRVR